ncbi:DUF6418 domain-containing protein [Paraburkholderia sp. MMS20-SJTN17]|uniref:DUF6418 domain-containing protein n=1 Tax=Paraburkholderia translucens TaxID=2886945 RepID=A0ABS8KF31_9BURK|nr:DUF6418 domain-containing protein [Paraburkholderia sp. MMS20-SJTN17]MCC8403292.1 DUF6418 domain-containing protein [Paraburkholderia sp. MMS20-SJTN17]
MLMRSFMPANEISPNNAYGLIVAALMLLALATNAALPALGLASLSAAATFALACAGVLALVWWRPVFSVSMLYLLCISLTVFLGGVGIEAGGYLTETGVQGEANGAFSRLVWFYVIFTACALAGFERVLPERRRIRGRIVPRLTIDNPSLMLGLALAAAVLAAGAIAGATEGFALLKGVNRFALRNDSEGAGPIFNLFLNNQLFVAVLLGTLWTAQSGWVRWLALSMSAADAVLEVLHGEQFMSVLGLSLSMLSPFVAILAMNGKPVKRYLVLGAVVALLLGSVSVFYAYQGQGLDTSDTMLSRVLLQGQVWYVVDGDATLFGAPQGGSAAFGRVLGSLSSLKAPTFFDDGAVSGLRDVMLAYGTPEILRAYIHDDVTFTMGQMAVPVYWFGFAGAAVFIAMTGLVYGALVALQIVVAMRGGIVLLWLTTKLVSYAGFGLQQGEYWNVFGIRTLAYAALACAWWYCVDARSARSTRPQRTWG